jgi:hypothetical protein
MESFNLCIDKGIQRSRSCERKEVTWRIETSQKTGPKGLYLARVRLGQRVLSMVILAVRCMENDGEK